MGIHSEMVSDGIVDLIQAGVITNKKKNFNPNKVIATFLLGTKKLYDYANNNPAIELHPVDYVNNPMIIAQNNNMISIKLSNTSWFNGQVNAEYINSKQF